MDSKLDLWNDGEILAQVQELKALTDARRTIFEKVIANPDGAALVAAHERLSEAFEKFRLAFFDLARRRNVDLAGGLRVDPGDAFHRLMAENALRYPQEPVGLALANGHAAGVFRTALLAILDGLIGDQLVARNDQPRVLR